MILPLEWPAGQSVRHFLVDMGGTTPGQVVLSGISSLSKPGEHGRMWHCSMDLLQVPTLTSLNDRLGLEGDISPLLPKLVSISVLSEQ